jgi:hypothetical protein
MTSIGLDVTRPCSQAAPTPLFVASIFSLPLFPVSDSEVKWEKSLIAKKYLTQNDAGGVEWFTNDRIKKDVKRSMPLRPKPPKDVDGVMFVPLFPLLTPHLLTSSRLCTLHAGGNKPLFRAFVREIKGAVSKAIADYLAAFDSDLLYNFTRENFGPDAALTIIGEFGEMSALSWIAST